jgi:hypothetical protein
MNSSLQIVLLGVFSIISGVVCQSRSNHSTLIVVPYSLCNENTGCFVIDYTFIPVKPRTEKKTRVYVLPFNRIIVFNTCLFTSTKIKERKKNTLVPLGAHLFFFLLHTLFFSGRNCFSLGFWIRMAMMMMKAEAPMRAAKVSSGALRILLVCAPFLVLTS